MKIRDVASQFTVYVFSADVDRGAGIKVALARDGYDASFFESRDSLLSRVAQKAPHVVVFPTAALKENLSDFVQALLKASAETRFIVLAPPVQFQTLAAYADHGLVDMLADQTVGLETRVLFAVDRACERLYLQYQNEHLLDEVEQATALVKKHEVALKDREDRLAHLPPRLEGRVKDYSEAESAEDLLTRFARHAGDAPCVYLRYLPSVRSFVAIVAAGFGNADIQGVGCQLTPEEAKDLGTQVTLGMVAPSLQTLLQQAFRFPSVRLLPLFVRNQLEGIVAYPGTLDAGPKSRLEDEFALMSMAYGRLTVEKRIELLEVQDPVTETFNGRFYHQRLAEEWNRAQREQRPLSLVKLALDDFYELEQTLGESTRDEMLKTLTRAIKKGSRSFDILCRTSSNEFALILPNCERQGAMIRAERLRRFVESTQMLENGLKVSISLGISEYPTLCPTEEALDQTAGKALAHIMDKGGNRLCLYKAPAEHRPEFAVKSSTEPA